MEYKVEWKTFDTSKWNGNKVDWKWNEKWNGKKLRPRSGVESKWNGNGMESGMEKYRTGYVEWKRTGMDSGMEIEQKIFARDRWNGKKLEWNGMEYIMNYGLENLTNIFHPTFQF